MNPFAQVSGGRQPVKTAFPVGNDEDVAGVGNQSSHWPVAYNTLKSSEPHERQLHWR